MIKFIIPSNQCLDDYILNYELCKIANINSNTYLFWKNVICASYQGSKTIFLHKSSILDKYKSYIDKCTNLNGYVLASAFCSFTGLANSHLVKSNKSNLYDKLDIKSIDKLKFINLKKFYDDLGLPYEMRIYIEKCKYFSPTPLEKRIKLTDTLCLGYY
ncbi:cysteine permease [Campylobacter hyointestinalis]|uniref:cysteine permease n=1 Tax=Campylobacter hyointestinalis TaxID=198 RepID=UPI002556F6AF|nr:cysteine permease [Campylobacter hyointestinalis]MDL2345980.1 cysteine permease [Campylobacter hyointestinalis]MDL2347720.1 cysteine permease [Campylobacter hyointestinalis]MDL2349462.1 cysteine permease [Campylobacter hyointestinalis]MDM1025863.1 cysteine permease [Campylobacter hyointestinalis]MDM1028520.1 cysteine permease [Campylobacter hyointestinalis]